MGLGEVLLEKSSIFGFFKGRLTVTYDKSIIPTDKSGPVRRGTHLGLQAEGGKYV